MKQRGWPIWLLRDVASFWSVLCSFLSLLIFTITSDGAAMRKAAVRDRVSNLLADAEARRIAGSGPTYLTFDVDGIDPAYTPGTGTLSIAATHTQARYTLPAPVAAPTASTTTGFSRPRSCGC